MKEFVLVALLTLGFAKNSKAQAFDYLYRFGATCGAGATTSTVSTKPTFGCGVGGNPLVIIYTEVGIMAPQANRSLFSGYVSNDLMLPLTGFGKTKHKYTPIVLGGYTRMFETGHALDYGVAVAFDRPRSKDSYNGKSVQLELRDYWTFANPTQHNVMFRVNWLVGVPD